MTSPVSGMTTLSTVNTEHCAQLSDGQTMEIEDSESRPRCSHCTQGGDGKMPDITMEDWRIIQ